MKIELRGLIVIGLTVCAMLWAIPGSAQGQPGGTGTITTIDDPYAGTGASQGTHPYSINPAGTITGDYVDSSNEIHGFVRDARGTITEFDAPGSQFIRPASINPAGTITGTYTDSSNVDHGFVRRK